MSFTPIQCVKYKEVYTKYILDSDPLCLSLQGVPLYTDQHPSDTVSAQQSQDAARPAAPPLQRSLGKTLQQVP